ncbi:polysaccharide deacetylase family protein [Desulfosarcina sp.]|uniref:polysaccharide deacetylase family protein n=1 Tax=Desulfosarcina sp. TaxID=2027861 RepID=UPI0039707BAB
MSNRPIDFLPGPWKPALACKVFRVAVVCAALLVGCGLRPPALCGQQKNAASASVPPLLVNPRQEEAPADMARRYLNDASKGWMILEYNEVDYVSPGRAVMVPMAPFRPGGLTPGGYQSVPVLAYVDIGEESGRKLRVARSAFNRQMRWLKSEGFTAITPDQLVAFMEFPGQLPHRSVLITFDTVSSALDEIAIPILTEVGFTATVFVATAGVGRKGAMSWDRIQELHANGFTIGCRGRSGQSLTRLSQGEPLEAYFKAVESEMHLARKTIEMHLDAPCRFLAYPHGDTNSLVAAMAAKLGFSAAFILSAGDNPFFADRFAIHRTVIDGGVVPERFASLLTTLIPADLN